MTGRQRLVQCLLLSIRLNPLAVQHLLHETGSGFVIVSPRTRKSIEDAIPATSMTDVADFESFLSASTSTDAYLCRVVDSRRMIREDDGNVLVLHSSGTTGQSTGRTGCVKRVLIDTLSGLPKAIPLAHRYVLGYAACHEFPVTEDLSRGGYNLSTLPLFHVRSLLSPKTKTLSSVLTGGHGVL